MFSLPVKLFKEFSRFPAPIATMLIIVMSVFLFSAYVVDKLLLCAKLSDAAINTVVLIIVITVIFVFASTVFFLFAYILKKYANIKSIFAGNKQSLLDKVANLTERNRQLEKDNSKYLAIISNLAKTGDKAGHA